MWTSAFPPWFNVLNHREMVFPKTTGVNKVRVMRQLSFWGWGWGFLSSNFTLLLPPFISLHLCLSLSRNLWPISHHRCLAGWCFFVSLQLFTPSLMLRFPFPNASHPFSHSHLLLCRNGGLFLELTWWFKDVKFILCHGFSERKQAMSLFAP